jgi:uncharacterized membrane protein
MNKQEFMSSLRAKLSAIPKKDAEERVTFYSEMIDDKIEEGILEEDAVASIGSIDVIAAQILTEYLSAKNTEKQPKVKRTLRTWEIVLLVVGAPIWLSLFIATVAVLFSLYAVLWSLVVAVWAVFASLAVCAPCGLIAGIGFAFGGNAPSGLAIMSAGLVCAGLTIFLYFGCKAATKGVVLLSKQITAWLKKGFAKKESV